MFMILVLSTLTSMGQYDVDIDEGLLLGNWKSYSSEKMELLLQGVGKITVNKLSLNNKRDSYISTPSDGVKPDGTISMGYTFTTFFVSNGNKLHLVSAYPDTLPSVTFEIDFLVEHPDLNLLLLCLRPLGEPHENYYIFSKEGYVSDITRNVSISEPNGLKYDLKGIISSDKKGVYIKDGKKHIAK